MFHISSWKQQFADIKAEMKGLYLRDKKPWILFSSKGKDSTLMLTLTWEMLSDLPPELRHKVVHVVTSDTKVEVPSMTQYVHESLAKVQRAADEQGIPVKVHLALPEMRDSFFFQVIGRGNVPPTNKSSYRWCTSRLKLNAGDRVTEEILAHETAKNGVDLENGKYDCLMLLAVREGESENRKQSIQKFTIKDKFARHVKYPNALVYHPIKFVDVQELWTYLMDPGYLALGNRFDGPIQHV